MALGIVEPRRYRPAKYNRRGHHRPGERPAASLVDTDDDACVRDRETRSDP
jgi:hypothetical protein